VGVIIFFPQQPKNIKTSNGFMSTAPFDLLVNIFALFENVF
jgi:hypothetical protein